MGSNELPLIVLIPQPVFFFVFFCHQGSSGGDSSPGQWARVHLRCTYSMLSPELLGASGWVFFSTAVEAEITPVHPLGGHP